MPQTEIRFDEALAVLARHEVEFLVVGGIAAVLHGSPLTTQDLDIVYSTSGENRRRLLEALEEMDASYADPAGRTIRPDLERLGSLRVHLLETRLGRVDLMRTIGRDLGFDDLIGRTLEMEVGAFSVPVLDLEAIIETKEHADRPKDLYQLPFLRQLLEEIRRFEEE